MNIKKTSLVLIAVVVAMLTLALMVVSVSADTSINVMANNCNCGHDCNTIYIQSSISACCSISDGAFPHCILSDMPDSEALLPSRTTLNLGVPNSQYVQGRSIEVASRSKQPLEQESSQLLPTHLCSEYHCRNSLNSEGPLLS